MILNQNIEKNISKIYNQLDMEGKLLSEKKLKDCYHLFRSKFGPEVLKNLDGEELLLKLHAHGNQDSLVYWLEFKDEEEFPGIFGGIGGGSALKFGLYRRKDTQEWMIGSPRSQKKISTSQAIKIAKQHRDQLLNGCEILEQFPLDRNDKSFETLQSELDNECPTISKYAWVHKYFHLLFPEILDDFHNQDFQNFHLIKLLIDPPEGEGRYLAAGKFLQIANQIEIPINHLTKTLVVRNGNPYRYWRIGTSDSKTPRNRWDLMKNNNVIAIGWEKLGDLSHIKYNQESKNIVKKLMEKHYPKIPQAIGRATQQVFHFVTAIEEGDLIFAADGGTIIGIGRVTGNYKYDPSTDFPHHRDVEWITTDEWKMPNKEGLQTTVHQIRKHPKNRIELEKRIFSKLGYTFSSSYIPQQHRFLRKLTGIQGRLQSILSRKGQVILYGPPGTGKTYWAEKIALNLIARNELGKDFEKLSEKEKEAIKTDTKKSICFLQTCCFHPNYGYEDFIEGYRPNTIKGQVNFQIKNGIFKTLCDSAGKNPSKKFYLIIDEINRGDISRIFGELLMILEKDKRGKSILLPLSGDLFQVPENVYVIGTMNTADRSIALLDTALRRRFGFIEFMPDPKVLKDVVINGIPLGVLLSSFNKRIRQHIGHNARNLQIGHSFFMKEGNPIESVEQLAETIRDDVIPLLEEYCYEDYSLLDKIIGKAFIDTETLTIREELFEKSNEEDFIRALVAPDSDILTSLQATESEEEVPEESDIEQENETED